MMGGKIQQCESGPHMLDNKITTGGSYPTGFYPEEYRQHTKNETCVLAP